MIAFWELFSQENFSTTILALCLCVGASVLWVLYMMQLVTNEEEIAERIRAEMRHIEEERRIKDDRKRSRQQQERELIQSLSEESAKKMNEADEKEASGKSKASSK